MGIFVGVGRWLLAASLVVWLTGCGGGSGGSGDSVAENPAPSEPDPSTPEEDGGDEDDGAGSTPPEEDDDSTPPEEAPNEPPVASIQFPLSGSRTTGAFISVRGTASDPDGDAIISVTVNGMLANTDDAFATWQVSGVTLLDGANTLEGLVQDAEGNVATFSLPMERSAYPGAAMRNPNDMAFDPNNGAPRLLVTDYVMDALVAVDLREGPTLGHRTIITQKGDGKGDDFQTPAAVELDAPNNRAIVLDRQRDMLYDVDLDSGEHSALAATAPEGSFSFPWSIALDMVNERILIADSGDAAGLTALNLSDLEAGVERIVQVDVASSVELAPGNPNRALVVDPSRNKLFEVDVEAKTKSEIASFTNPINAIFDPNDSNRALVLSVEGDEDAILEVNLSDGSIGLLSGWDATAAGDTAEGEVQRRGKGPRFDNFYSIVVDPAIPDRALVSSLDPKRIFTVDLVTGDRHALEASMGDGPDFFRPTNVALLPSDVSGQLPTAIVLDNVLNNDRTIYGVSLDAESLGDRVTLSGFDAANPNQPRGTGVELNDPGDLVVDAVNGRILVADDDVDAVVAVDLVTGDRTVLSGEEVGSGPLFTTPNAIALDSVNNRALVADNFGALYAVDLDTGDRSLVSGDDTGSGAELRTPVAMALDAGHNRLVVADVPDTAAASLMAVDLESGDRSVISGENVGSGALLDSPSAVSLDVANNRALVVDADLRGVLAIDLATGDREIISTSWPGPDAEYGTDDDEFVGGGSPFNASAELSGGFLDADRRILYVTDSVSGSLIAVDIDSGDRVLVSGFTF